MTDEPTKISWWQHPVRVWFRDPGFWREVTARALSTVIAAGIVYLLALTFGYLKTPDHFNLVAGILTSVLAVVLGGMILSAPFATGPGTQTVDEAYEQIMRKRRLRRESHRWRKKADDK